MATFSGGFSVFYADLTKKEKRKVLKKEKRGGE
jgi:hypothetical protein